MEPSRVWYQVTPPDPSAISVSPPENQLMPWNVSDGPWLVPRLGDPIQILSRSLAGCHACKNSALGVRIRSSYVEYMYSGRQIA